MLMPRPVRRLYAGTSIGRLCACPREHPAPVKSTPRRGPLHSIKPPTTGAVAYRTNSCAPNTSAVSAVPVPKVAARVEKGAERVGQAEDHFVRERAREYDAPAVVGGGVDRQVWHGYG
jgi:hypothetical protein